jgi:N-methylhydantoinase A
MSRFVQVADQPIGVSAVDVHTIGAGGGSIAWVDFGGALRVGPRSAGARPGPAGYGAGGTEPTVTDANVVLGYLLPEAFLGGRRRLDRELSEAALRERIAEPLGISTLEAALGVVRIVNSNIEMAIRAVSVERGIDPRSLSLVCGGGAGGLHCAAVAKGLEISRVFVPREAGVLCSFGMTVTDVRQDRTASLHALSDELDPDRVESLLTKMEKDLLSEFQIAGYDDEAIALERTVDARYPGQHHEITIVIPRSLETQAIEEIESAFHAEHRLLYAYDRPELPVEFFHWRVTAIGHHYAPSRSGDYERGSQPPSSDIEPDHDKPVYFAGYEEPLSTRFFMADSLGAGDEIRGPAVVIAATTTVVVPPSDVLKMETADGFTILVNAQ